MWCLDGWDRLFGRNNMLQEVDVDPGQKSRWMARGWSLQLLQMSALCTPTLKSIPFNLWNAHLEQPLVKIGIPLQIVCYGKQIDSKRDPTTMPKPSYGGTSDNRQNRILPRSYPRGLTQSSLSSLLPVSGDFEKTKYQPQISGLPTSFGMWKYFSCVKEVSWSTNIPGTYSPQTHQVVWTPLHTPYLAGSQNEQHV